MSQGGCRIAMPSSVMTAPVSQPGGSEETRRSLHCRHGTTHVAYRAALMKEEFERHGLKYRLDDGTTHSQQIEEYEVADAIVFHPHSSGNRPRAGVPVENCT